MIRYKCFELHTHTLQSDGEFTLAELRERAGEFLYDAIAVTDHNTQSALEELSPGPGIPVIPGIEWTTYYGHMVVLGADEYIDWRFARPETIDEYTQAIKNVRGVVGIAHPFEFGSPLCTGCYWDFKVQNWETIDYIEVWSNPFPHSALKNHLAFEWWTSLLNQGHHLAAAAGWDWHRLEKGKPPLPPATWLGLRDGRIDTAGVRDALE
ncbi:MAG: CehA/McbA family metallohydrolase, partial [Treponema sp.]|nr:CehA/McbA family metallohydrolase [Treponema sp.]